MAKKTIFVSDLTGETIEKDAATVTIRYSDARRGQVVLDVNATEVDDLAAEARTSIPEDEPQDLDLAGLRMLTSAGVHVLLKPRAFGHVAIFCPAGPVSKVLDIVQAHRLVPIYADFQAAVVS